MTEFMLQHSAPVSTMKKLGGVLLIAGTSIGAGMLAIPYAVAAAGFFYAVILLLVNWLIMLATALLMVEVNTRQPIAADLNTMAKATLGKSGQVINWLTYLLLLYALATAYVSMGGSLIDQYIFRSPSIAPSWYGGVLFSGILGAVVYIGTAVVDQLNKVFFALKAFCFIGFVAVVVLHVDTKLLFHNSLGFSYAWYAIPILITSFGFHIVIPTVRNYFNNDIVFKKTVVVGACVPLFVYFLWVTVTLGVIPINGDYGFIFLLQKGLDLGAGYQHLSKINDASIFIVAFSNIAVTTSFFGVTLALFHFNQDAYSLKHSISKRLLNFVITYVPPFVFAVFFVDGFLHALGYASIFVAILLIILPALMAWSLRNKEHRNTLTSKFVLCLLVIGGVTIIALQVLLSFDLLPILK